jgi:N6-L-threonylcarbamoyladenine synthase
MKLLAIETSCDETAIAILECEGDAASSRFTVLGNALLSQIDIHKEYGGVYPAVAKREHAKNLVPVLAASLEEAELMKESVQAIPGKTKELLTALLSREPGLETALLDFASRTEAPDIDAIAVTHGPGLEPALWVGINFAKALSLLWEKPIIPVNHMEGHFLSALSRKEGEDIRISNVALPILGLLISGGHTELVLMRQWLTYELLGQTRDDAVGEAFDKVARMMDLPYPGGPEISRLAEKGRQDEVANSFTLPRPMIDSGDFDFSFSGLKTAVLYLIKEKGGLTEREKEQLALAFEDAVGDVLLKKTVCAIEATGAQTVVMGGGVSANIHLQRLFKENISGTELRIPEQEFTTDNAVMIGMAGFYRAKETHDDIRADGTLALM